MPPTCHKPRILLMISSIPQRDPARKTLIETYGWQDNFRQEDWARDVEEVWDGIIRHAVD